MRPIGCDGRIDELSHEIAGKQENSQGDHQHHPTVQCMDLSFAIHGSYLQRDVFRK